MKTTRPNRARLFTLIALVCVVCSMHGCFWKGDEVKFPKVSDPENTSAGCAQSQGFDPELTKQLAEALKDYDGEINDEFKLKASALVTESDSVPTANRNSV
ncbi:MAG: hypothetical protein ACREOP_15590, partial [Thermodesulfobacteriota bacterium]